MYYDMARYPPVRNKELKGGTIASIASEIQESTPTPVPLGRGLGVGRLNHNEAFKQEISFQYSVGMNSIGQGDFYYKI